MKAAEYWNDRYARGGNSGYGSYDQQLVKKLSWLSGLPIASISEIGCGDLNFFKNLARFYPNVRYAGSDISSVVIERNKKQFPNFNFQTTNDLARSDLLLCVDVLFHILDDKEYEELIATLQTDWYKYLAVTAYEREGKPGETAPHVKIRNFNYKQFGEPVIREVVEEDGQLYFYLFKTGVDLSNVSCCLNTKDKEYPKEILDHVSQFPFAEVIVETGSDSPYGKYKAFAKAKSEYIYYQDDDAICPIRQLSELSKPTMINVAMKPGHLEAYKDKKMTMGLGWGSIFHKDFLKSLDLWRAKWGEDDIFKRETERVLTSLNYPQNRLSLDIIDLPSAWAEDRLWKQPNHHTYLPIVEARCEELLKSIK